MGCALSGEFWKLAFFHIFCRKEEPASHLYTQMQSGSCPNPSTTGKEKVQPIGRSFSFLFMKYFVNEKCEIILF